MVGLYFDVSDTGIGIAPERMDSIFEVFTQVDGSRTRQYAGAGIGLSITKRLVELMGGDIVVSSKIEEGSIFSFTIYLKSCESDEISQVDIETKEIEEVDNNSQDISSEIRAEIDSLCKLLIKGDSRSMEVFGKMKEHIKSCTSREDYNYLESRMQQFEFEQVNEKLTELLDNQQNQKVYGVDIKGGISRVANNKELYFTLLNSFAQKYGNITEEIRSFYLQEEFDEMAIVVHSLKGACGNVGAERLYQLFTDLEKLTIIGKTSDSIVSLLNQTENEIKKVVMSIESVMDPVTPHSETIVKTSWTEEMQKQLSEYLEKGDPVALQTWKDLQYGFQEKYGDSTVEKLNDYIGSYEFTQAKKLLDELN